MKKNVKKFGVKEKRCTFAIPFGKERKKRSLTRLEEQEQVQASTEKKLVEILKINRETSILFEESEGQAVKLRDNFFYTMKSLILAQDER